RAVLVERQVRNDPALQVHRAVEPVIDGVMTQGCRHDAQCLIQVGRDIEVEVGRALRGQVERRSRGTLGNALAGYLERDVDTPHRYRARVRVLRVQAEAQLLLQ